MSSRRGRLATGVVALLAGLAALLAVPSTHGALTGKVTNSTNTVAASVFGSTTSCTQAVRATPAAWVAYPFAESSGTSAADVSGNNRTGTYTSAGVTYGVAGPCPRDAWKAVTLDGRSGYVLGPSAMNPQTFSVQVWFRTTTASGGKLVGYGNGGLLTDTSTDYDRHVYTSNNGTLTFGVYPGGVRTVTSPKAYNDGAWHQVVATLAPSGATQGMRLYVDGALVASDTSVTSAQTILTGAWRFGFDNLDYWVNVPSSRYFAGSIAYGAVWTSALTAAQVQTLYKAGV